jgi:hypothetical protein
MAALMSNMPEVHPVTVQIRAANTRRNDPGQISYGYYIVSESKVTLTDAAGKPVRDAQGKTYIQKLGPDDSAKQIAGRLTKEFRLVLLGKTNTAAGFSRPLSYPKINVA